MLNSQPLGFYTPSQLVQDARRHHIEVRPIDVTTSDWDCTLEEEAAAPAKWAAPRNLGSDPATKWGSDPDFVIPQNLDQPQAIETKSGSDPHFPNPSQEAASKAPHPPVRLGLRLVATLAEPAARRILAARQHHPFTTTEDLALRAALDAGDLKALAAADALTALSGHRRQQVWDASALHRAPELLREAPTHEAPLALIEAGEGEAIAHDYAATGLTLRRHPLALLRPELARWKLRTATQLRDLPDGTPTRACGIVTVRQQPGTAKGVTFVTLEDETGTVNVIVWKALRERQRRELVRSRLLAVQGTWQRDVESGGEVRHLIATRLRDLTPLLGDLMTGSRDFH
jgi:error-prone DNA polymerase